MTSNRLTQNMRGAIVNAVLRHKFLAEIETLRLQYSTLAITNYNEIYKKIIPRMNELPEGWLPTMASISVKFGATNVNLSFDGQFWSNSHYGTKQTLAIYEIAPTPPDIWLHITHSKNGQYAEVFDADHKHSIEFDRLENLKVDLNAKISEARKQTAAALDKFFTVDKLLEAWPEIEPFTKGITPEPKPKLPMVPIADLNGLLDLPVAAE